MASYSGTIQIKASSGGTTLLLTNPNPDPPPAKLITLTLNDPPEWLWDAVKGNAGRPATVDVNDVGGAPMSVAVG